MLGDHLILAAGDPQSHVLPHGLFKIFDFNIPTPIGNPIDEFWFTNHILMTILAAVVTAVIFIPIGNRYAARLAGGRADYSPPGGFAGLVEGFMDALRNAVVRPVLGNSTDAFMPFLWTLFFFILINNLLGMVPIEAVFSLAGVKHVGGTATGNINVTGGLALCAFFMIHFSGMREIHHALRAGTYGAHGHDEPHGEEPPHGNHDAERGAHGASSGMSAAAAVIATPGLYLWNFAPHVFAPHEKRHPSLALRPVMVVLYAAIGAVAYYGLFTMFGLRGTALNAACAVGGVFGAVYALASGGLSPWDLLDAAVWVLFLLLEFIGALVKPFALCMRLFANMIAGHIVLASILLVMPAIHHLTVMNVAMSIPIALGCVLLSCLELFVAFLQAYIFMFLTSMFINMAVNPEH